MPKSPSYCLEIRRVRLVKRPCQRNSFPPSRKIGLAINPAAQSHLDFSGKPGYGLRLQPIPKLKVFAIVIVEETQASAFWTPAFAPAMPRDHGTDCATSQKHERCRCACQFIEPKDPQVEAGMDGVARNRSKSVELFSGGMIRAEPTRVQMKAWSPFFVLKRNVRAGCVTDSTTYMAPHRAARQTRKSDESSMRDEEMLAIP